MKLSAEDLRRNLTQFIGTDTYHRILPSFVVTDGFKYLIDKGECYWLARLYGLHLINVDFNSTPFTLLNIKTLRAKLRISIEDGNGNAFVSQNVHVTDFPLNDLTLYACWSGDHWIGMLPSEY